MGGVLAIDLGTKRTGFALADPERIVACPLGVVAVPEDDPRLLEHVAKLLQDHEVATLLVGLPLGSDGSEGTRARAVRAFVTRLEGRFPGLEVVPYDERLTTKEAEQLLGEAGFRGADRKARRDSWSALVLLRDWIESGEPRPTG